MRNLFPEGGFNKKLDDKIDRERLVKLAYEKSKLLIEKYSIQEESLRKDMYGDSVDDDLAEVSGIERRIFQETDEDLMENRKLSEIFNAIVLDQFERNNWMGENAITIGTAKYDRLKTGISNITEFHEDKGVSYLAMGIRVTFSSNLEKKLLEIKENIRKGELSRIKYFESDFHRGELKKVPSVIVGCSKKMLLEVIELWLQNNNKALSEHPLQFFILDQINEQINYFKKEASFTGKHELIEIYENVQNNINEIIRKKNDLRGKLENPKEEENSLTSKENDDIVMSSLRDKLKYIF